MNANHSLQWKLLAIGLLLLSNAHAVTLHWGGAVGDFMFESDGVTSVDPAEFSFELGLFEDGFTPSLDNASDWAMNWNVLDEGSYNAMTGYLAGSVNLSADNGISDGNATEPASTFFGKDAYIWVYNQNTAIDETLEWALLSNPTGGGSAATEWTFPDSTEAQTHAGVIDFRISDPGVTPVFGSENQGPPSSGEGFQEASPSVPYGLQTATIPEPSSALLVLLGMASLLSNRKRH